MRIENKLILSVFPGIDLLGRGFENNGFCVVRGPDIITGGDIQNFNPPPGVFAGVIGGPPCQDFSKLNRNPGDNSLKMLGEFVRVIEAAGPDWFLCENVVGVPDITPTGYTVQRFGLDLGWFSAFSRLRHFQFGSRCSSMLNPVTGQKTSIEGCAVLGGDSRGFSACCEIQGLPADFDIPFFTLSGKKQAVGNSVPLQISNYLARLINATLYDAVAELRDIPLPDRRCLCGCGRVVVGRAKYASGGCRKRAFTKRNIAELGNGGH